MSGRTASFVDKVSETGFHAHDKSLGTGRSAERVALNRATACYIPGVDLGALDPPVDQ